MGVFEGFIYILGCFSGAALAMIIWMFLDSIAKLFKKQLNKKFDSRDDEIFKRFHAITDYKIEGHEVRYHKKKGFIWILI